MSEDNKLIVERKKKLEELSSLNKIYPNSFKRNITSNELIERFSSYEKENLENENEYFL